MNPVARRTRTLAVLLGALVLAASYGLIAQANAPDAKTAGASPPCWEYLTKYCHEVNLAAKGEEGWELVAVTHTIDKWTLGFETRESRFDGRLPPFSEAKGASGKMIGSGTCTMYLKRQK